MAKQRLSFLRKTFFVKLISIAFVVGSTLALFSGFFSKPDYTFSDTKTIKLPISEVWQILENDDNHPLHRSQMTRGVDIAYTTISQTKPTNMVLACTIPHYKFKAQWNYQLEEVSGTETRVTITETSSVNHYGFRLLLTFIGRHSIVKQEFRALEKIL